MPEKETIRRAHKDAEEGKAPTTQAGEFVREEMHHAKSGKHPVKNRKQAIAIGLSKAREAGIDVPPKGQKTAAKGARRSQAQTKSKGRSKGAKS